MKKPKMLSNRAHKSRRVKLKEVDIDVGILPVVEWLNSFPGVFTRWSCQGYLKRDNNDWRNDPYIIFICDDPLALAEILRRTSRDAHCQVEFYEPMNGLRYNLKFKNREHLRRFVRDMAKSLQNYAWEDASSVAG